MVIKFGELALSRYILTKFKFGDMNSYKSTLTRVCNVQYSSVDGVFHE